jgi:hypothetical protein
MDKINKIIAITISILILTFSTWFIINDKKIFSENEFRYLEKFPQFSMNNLLEGKYIESLENYFTDHFPLRENFVSLKTQVFILTNQKLVNEVYIAKNNFLINRFTKPENSEKIINIINNFKENNKELNISMLLVPTATSIYDDLLPKPNINYSEKEAIEYYYNNLKIETINLYDTLLNQKNNYQLYYKTDHHWTSFGAYLAYQEFCKKNNIKYYELNELNVELVNQSFLGTLYSKVFTTNQEKDKIYKIYDKNNDFTVKYIDKTTNTLFEEQYLKEKDKYSYFLNTNQPIIEITNNTIQNNEEILIIKDSFANSFIPILANHYKKIHVIDPRYYNLSISDYIKEKNLKNILLLYNINNIDTDTGILKLR